ncbi:hypothetical protein I317_04215 [Kwoniella heveanensis CBS 569]|uniref:Thioesterase n=1 Tax=Kwoniella heveanensis BCC8398 TaxID=1296120 RepID=A0A1B9GX08_9TREE|nr:hypothetical protein I316_02605 [Kwoniella heveanensis BCC8398]OCF41914.1 hypothetical protein I317_04215 [Kwoniella heveanensis CBS 569]
MFELVQQLPANVVTGLRTVLAKLSMNSSTPLLPFIPKPVKVLLLLLFILHSPSWPFTWHIRVWYWGIKAYYLAWRKGRSKYLKDWKTQSNKNGGIRDLRTRIRRIAWLDDCDYNLHLSNSCYAKNSDEAKMDWCIQALSPVFTSGAHMALGATHYNFFKEIPLGSEYVMEVRCGGWDEKWMYVVIEFIIYPGKGKGRGKGQNNGAKPTDVLTAAASSASTKLSETSSSSAPVPPLVPSISDPPTRSTSPMPSANGTGTSTPSNATTSKVEALKRAWAVKRGQREDGGVVCCMSISEYCFKMGRVTIPPRIAAWMSLQSPSTADQDRARAIVMSKDGGRAFLRGGWKEEPNADQLGADIGIANGEGEEDSWRGKGRQGMEKVVEGMTVF